MREQERRSRPMARKLRRTMTKAETILWTVLKARSMNGWRFRRQHPIGPYVADFACLEAKLIVEVDGATHGEPDEIEHDRRRSAFLTRRGYDILRVGNLDVYEDLDGVVRLIAASLAPLGPSGHSPRERGEISLERLTMSSPACGGGDGGADAGGITNTHHPNGRTPDDRRLYL